MTSANFRFSDRVDDYAKYRPDYPRQLITHLEQSSGLTKESNLVDMGSGTGLLSQLFLENGNQVIGIEPDNKMLSAGKLLLVEYPAFSCFNKTAECTGLADNSVDLIIAGHAAHWFKPLEARTEFQRILKPEGKIALIWNTRDKNSSDFMKRFEKIMLKFAKDKMGQPGFEGGEKRDPEAILGKDYTLRTFQHKQQLDLEGLIGRVKSSSMMPLEGEVNFQEMLKSLETIFSLFQKHGFVDIDYKTEIYTN